MIEASAVLDFIFILNIFVLFVILKLFISSSLVSNIYPWIPWIPCPFSRIIMKGTPILLLIHVLIS